VGCASAAEDAIWAGIRTLPPAVNTAVYARFAELAEMMAPSHDEFEAAFDIAVHGTREPV